MVDEATHIKKSEASITVSATPDENVNPQMSLFSDAEALWSRTSASGATDAMIEVKSDKEKQTLEELLSIYKSEQKLSNKNNRLIKNFYNIANEDRNRWLEVKDNIEKLKKEQEEIDKKNCLNCLKSPKSAYLDQEDYYIKLHRYLFSIMLWKMARPGSKVRVNY